MVKVIGTTKTFDNKTIKINENFKTYAEAKRFKQFIRGKTKIEYKRKSLRRKANPYGLNMQWGGLRL